MPLFNKGRRRTTLRSNERRTLRAETLERRMLLTAVTGSVPAPNSHTASISTDIAATFDQDIDPATATPETFVVHSQRSGRRVGSVVTAGATVTFDAASNYVPGELVRVSATPGIQNTSGAAADPRVWEFRTEVSGGSGELVGGDAIRLGTHHSYDVGLGDLDGDGDLDAMVTNWEYQGNRIWINDGGQFTDSGQILGMEESRRLALGDLDGDGDLDVFIANVTANRVWLNDGGVFRDSGQLLGALHNVGVGLGDFDGDGDLDAVMATSIRVEPAGSTGESRIWLNSGDGTFTDSGQLLGPHDSTNISIGDLDDDGDLDIFVSNNTSNHVWLNDGGVFTNSGQDFGNHYTGNIGLGDLDGDGDLDAFIANSGANHVWLNNGGQFTDSGQALGDHGSANVAIGDLDGDGDLDAMVTNAGYQGNRIWLNNGSGQFSSTGQSLGTRNSFGVELGDLDNDGDLDAFVANDGNVVGNAVWLNQNPPGQVTLSVDNSTIEEQSGVATVTATLSATAAQTVTVNLDISGTATVAADYTASGTQIVIPGGATSGSITLTAVQDTLDEPNETVIVDIASVTNGQEVGTQQVVVTIVDDDEAPMPDVTLAVDAGEIAEAGGVATFTVTLSVATTVPVTVDLAMSGTAAASDYTASGSQIVIAPGATTGSVTVTAVQDEQDEDDETVVVDVTAVTGGNELGTQQQMTTITDDDELVVPDVTLSVDEASIPEAVGVAIFTATLSEATTVPVTVDLEMTGSATVGDDYNASGTQISIAAGATTGSVTVTAVPDEQDEPDETVVVDISAVTNGTESGTQQATTTITDDDEPTGFAVTALTPTSTGFHVAFTNDIDVADLSLYDTQTAGLGPADVVLTGATSGLVSGSIVVDASQRMVEFIKTGDALVADTYTVTLRSAIDGFEDTGGLLLDGDGDGTGGDDYSSTFTVADPAAGTVTVGIPDIVRGPGQEVNLPADATTGIPLSISEGTNVRAIDARISYDPTLLNITAATLGPDAPAGASVILNSLTPGLAIVVYFATAPLPAGAGTFVNLQASVPTENASENYRRQQVLDVHSVIVSDGNDNESPVIDNDALQIATFFADVSANGRINAADAAQVARIAALLDGGFLNTPSTDPGLVGDISGNGRLNAADASLVAQYAALIDVPQIPPIPGGVVIAGLAGADLRPGLPGVTTLPSRLVDRRANSTTANSPDSSERSTESVAASDLRYPAVDRAMAEFGDSALEGDEDELLPPLEGAVEQLLSAERLFD